jgi:hypothetical protein
VFLPSLTFFVWTALLLGGAATVFGPLLGAVIFWVLQAFVGAVLPALVESGILSFMTSQQASTMRFILVGIGLILLIVLSMVLVRQYRWKSILMLAIVAVYWLISAETGNVYLSSLGDQSAIESAGDGRLVQWKRIWESMPGSYLLGHAPAKEYFEEHGIFSESEYFLILFRYGFIGLCAYVLFMLSIVLPALSIKRENAFLLVAPVVLWAFAALSSNPLHSNKLAVVIAFTLGFVFSLVYGRTCMSEVDGNRAR